MFGSRETGTRLEPDRMFRDVSVMPDRYGMIAAEDSDAGGGVVENATALTVGVVDRIGPVLLAAISGGLTGDRA
ncbi:hypothetical protein A0H81_03122 [Grifola frondosa]|uniref:Uncharacterized protein n=1 Tax=Grifola frondosa TaxID=5627 RepID=A0A1C7MHV6_GRIFR|nr:hypothetical protein A0H81_03122 [Grifola frondosa]